MPYCTKCGTEYTNEKVCPNCGTPINEYFLMVTTPSIPGFNIKKILGIVTGLTPRTRGVGGKFIAGIQSAFGGEVSAYTTELEKARYEALERVKDKAKQLGANAIIGLDMETSEVFQGVVVISATGTAVVVEPI